jgi:hypothetical protein
LAEFRAELAALDRSISEDLHLPSLRDNGLEGFAFLFAVVLPLLDSRGHPIATEPMLQELFLTVDNRFGGCLVPSSSSHPPYWGLWHPSGASRVEPEKAT